MSCPSYWLPASVLWMPASEVIPESDLFLHTLDLLREIEILLRNPSG